MKTFSKIILLFTFFFVSSCVNGIQQNKSSNYQRELYTSLGFALIYNNETFTNKIVNKKMKNDDLSIMHSSLRKNTLVRIINPVNSKFVMGKITNTATYPKIFNVVITEEISKLLELDIDNPYIEIIELKKNKKFIAKEANIFDEEKNVAEKAPVNDIEINDLSKNKSKIIKKNRKKKFTLLISDFYYEDTAIKLKKDLEKTTKSKNIFIKKINNNKYRLLVGPFNNFNALKTIYISLNNLGFEDLNIYME